MSTINFKKIQSTGNDFVVVDYNSVPSSLFEVKNIEKICNRNFGVGADGIIALEKSKEYAFRFHYYNADGSRAAMCGNGLRAAIRFAYEKGWVPEKDVFHFIADDGVHTGQVLGNTFKASILINDVIKEVATRDLSIPGWINKAFSINTGVPHLVLICTEDLREKEIFKLGRELRYHEKFKPQGTNANFVEILDKARFFIRTYERGVENETLSCGTGVTAATLILKSFYDYSGDAEIITNGGNLKVTFENKETFINGPSECTFTGKIDI